MIDLKNIFTCDYRYIADCSYVCLEKKKEKPKKQKHQSARSRFLEQLSP